MNRGFFMSNVYSDVCNQINVAYVDNFAYKDLHLTELPNYTSYNPKIMQYLRKLFNYHVLGINSDKEIEPYDADSSSEANKKVYNFISNFNSLDGGQFDGETINIVGLTLLTKGLAKEENVSIGITDYTDEFSIAYRDIITVLGAAATNDVILPEINALFNDNQLGLVGNLTDDTHAQKIQQIQKAVNYEFTNIADYHDTNLALAFNYGLQCPNGIENDKLIRDLGLAYQLAIGVEPAVWNNAYIANNLPCNSNGLKYVQYAAFLKNYTSDPNTIDASFITNANLRQIFNAKNPNISNLRMTKGIRLTGMANDVVQAMYVDHSNNKIYTLQKVQETNRIYRSDYQEMTSSIPSIEFNNYITIGDSLFGHTQTLSPLDNDGHLLIGVTGKLSSHSDNKWATEFALLDTSNMSAYFGNQYELHRLIGFNKYYRLEGTTNLNSNILVIQGTMNNGVGEIKKYDLNDTFSKLKNNTTVNVSSLNQIGDTIVIPDIASTTKGIGSLQGLSYLNNNLFISSQFGPIITDVSRYNKWLYALNKWPRQIIKFNWNDSNKNNWTYIPVTNLHGITVQELFERFNDETHNFATELENVIAVSNTSCDLLIEYHGVTEFGDQKLEDEPFLMHLEWSD